MPSWNGVPIPDSPQIKIPNSIPQNFNWESYAADPKGTFNKFKGARETHRINWKGYRTASSSTKKIVASSPSKKFISDAAKRIRELKKTTDNTKKIADATKKASDLSTKIQDALFKKIPGSNALDSASRVGGILGILSAIGLVALLKLQESISSRVFDNLDKINQDASNTLTTISKVNNKIKILEEKFRVIDRQVAADAKDFYRLNKQTETIGQQVVAAKKQANDALYETREGRKIVTGLAESARKLANDTLYEFRQNKAVVEAKITEQRLSFDAKIQSINAQILKFNSSASDAFQKAVNATISKVQSDLAATKAQVNAIRPADTAGITANAVAAAKALVTPLQSQIGALSSETNVGKMLAGIAINGVSNLAQAVSGANNIASLALSRADTAQATANNAQREAESSRTYVDRVLVPRIEATVTQSTGVTAEMARLETETQNTRTYVDRVLVPRIEATVTQSTGVKAEVAEIKKEVADIEQKQIPTLSAETKKIQIRISEVDTKLKDQEKVNEQALPKLDQILGILPFIPARAADAIRSSIPTIPQIEQAAATGTCRTTQSGGCMSRALNDNATNINNNNNANAANILDAVNTGANAALLAGQQTILQRLGDQLPGGIGGKLTRFAQWAHLDRALNIMNFAASVHNGAMLSNNLGQTLLSVIGNLLSIVGLKDAEGQPFDIGSVISKGIEGIIKNAIGEENYKTLDATWKRANRIYQAAANLLNSIQSLSASILSALEVIGQWNAKVANALKRFGVVGEKAYSWMNPNVNFQNKYFTALENATNVISQVDQVASEVLSIKETVGQIVEQKKELDDSLKQTDASKQKAEVPEAAKVAQKESEAKAASSALPLAENDKEADEDN